MVKALLAAEDARFYDHSGIDVIRIGGAALRDIATRRMSQGASTLTQQLARAVFLSPEKTIARKVNEAFLTVEIERQFSKDQILTMYLNQIPFGHGNYGVEAASRWYFGHAAKTLTLPEAALLAGIIQRPAYYSPVRNAAAAKTAARLRPPQDARGGVHLGRAARGGGRRADRGFEGNARVDGRAVLLRRGPAVPREAVRRVRALPRGTARRLDAGPAPPALGRGRAPLGAPAPGPPLRIPQAPQPRRGGTRPRDVEGPLLVGRCGRAVRRPHGRRPEHVEDGRRGARRRQALRAAGLGLRVDARRAAPPRRSRAATSSRSRRSRTTRASPRRSSRRTRTSRARPSSSRTGREPSARSSAATTSTARSSTAPSRRSARSAPRSSPSSS